MTRVQLGSQWRQIPQIVRLLMLPGCTPGPDIVVCDTCGATWETGTFADPDCHWCLRALENMRRWQAELVIEPPDVDPDDIRYDGAMDGWAERLAIAVEAELITRPKAETAWKRATSDMRPVPVL